MIEVKDELSKFKPIDDLETGSAKADSDELTDIIDIITQLEKKSSKGDV